MIAAVAATAAAAVWTAWQAAGCGVLIFTHAGGELVKYVAALLWKT